MSTTKILAAALLVSTSVTLAPAFADDRASTGTQVAAIDAQLPADATTDVAPAVTPRDDAARTGPVLSAKEVRARLFGVAPAKPGWRDNGADATLIREVAGMYKFQHYRPLEILQTDTAGSEAFETAAYVADNTPE